MVATTILSLVALLLSLAVYFVKRRYSYWKDMGVPSEAPVFPLGNLKGIGREFHQSKVMQRFYMKLKSAGTPFCGLYFFLSPVVLATSLDFIVRKFQDSSSGFTDFLPQRAVMVKDFSHFTDRGSYYNEDDGTTG